MAPFLGRSSLDAGAQEAISVGLNSATNFEDKIISSYRTHPFVLLRGGNLVSLLGELLGRVCGVSKGKGGSMHVFTHSFQGGHGIVGAQVPLGAGLAFAAKYQEKPVATYAMYGDGASNQGQVAESFNMVCWELWMPSQWYVLTRPDV